MGRQTEGSVMKPRFETLESRQLLAADLVSDFNTTPQSGRPVHLTHFQDQIYFFTDRTERAQLWRTDGQADNTELVYEFGSSGAPPIAPVVRGSEMIFIIGFELWKSDGTSAGTEAVTIGGALYVSDDASWAVRGEDVFLWAPSQQTLWVTQGDDASTKKIYAPEAGAGLPVYRDSSVIVFQDDVYFAISQGNQGDLWKSDGTIDGTVKVADYLGETKLGGVIGDSLIFENSINIWKTDGASEPTRLFTGASTGIISSVIDSHVYFSGTDEQHGTELWRTDGTLAGTELFVDVVEGPNGSHPSNLRVLNDGFVFDVYQLEADVLESLWFTDGTKDRTRLLYAGSRFYSDHSPRVIGDNYYFFIHDPESGFDAWQTDGTVDGTRPVPDDLFFGQPSGSGESVQFNGLTIFVVYSKEAGDEIWATDNTQTWLLADTRPGTLGSSPNLGLVGDRLWAVRTMDDPALPSLISIAPDGTETELDAQLSSFHLIPTNADFTYVIGHFGDTTSLYRTDGQILTLLKESGGFDFRAFGDSSVAFLTGSLNGGRQIWISDGTVDGTVPVTEEIEEFDSLGSIAVAGESIFFLQRGEGVELWKVAIGQDPQFVKQLTTEVEKPLKLQSFGDRVLITFQRRNAENKYPLWSSDGTAAGTQIILRADRRISQYLFELEGVFFFEAISGSEKGLWRTDGSLEGTQHVADLDISRQTIRYPAGTRIDLKSNQLLATANDRVYFVASDGEHGREVWTTDGTSKGTRMVTDLSPGPSNTFFATQFAVAGDQLFFTAYEASGNLGMWTSDGTQDGTYRIATDLPRGPYQLTPVGNTLYFAAFDQSVGDELFSIPIPEQRIVGDFDSNGMVNFDDFLILSENFGREDARSTEGDLNGDHKVGFADFLILSANFGQEHVMAFDAVDAVFESIR